MEEAIMIESYEYSFESHSYVPIIAVSGLTFAAGLFLGYKLHVILSESDKTTSPKSETELDTAKKMTLSKDTPGVFLGEAPNYHDQYYGKPLSKDGHVLVLGQSGSGKTSCLINPTMQTLAGSVVYFDPKGEILESYRMLVGNKPHQKCLIFSPYDQTLCNCWYNPYAPMENDPANKANELAKILIPEHDNDTNQIWRETAVAVLSGAILHYQSLGLSFAETMKAISDSNVPGLIDEIMTKGDEDAKSFVTKLSDMDEKVITGIGMELSSLAQFTSSEAFRYALSTEGGTKEKEELNWKVLNGYEPVTVFLVLPEDKLCSLGPLFRLMIDQLITSLTRREKRTYDRFELPPVTVILDEFPLLGCLPSLEHGLSTLRCRGVTMILLIQSLASLERYYGEPAARVIIENCEYKCIFGSTDVNSQKYLADLVGTSIMRRRSGSISASTSGLSISTGYTLERDAIIQPHMFHTLKNVVICTPYGVFEAKKRPVFNGEDVFG